MHARNQSKCIYKRESASIVVPVPWFKQSTIQATLCTPVSYYCIYINPTILHTVLYTMKTWYSAVTVVFSALLALGMARFEGEAKFLNTVLQYLESKEAKMMQNSGEYSSCS